MEQTKEKIKEIEQEISFWKQNQENYWQDEEFFHYSQRHIDRLESILDMMSRLEN